MSPTVPQPDLRAHAVRMTNLMVIEINDLSAAHDQEGRLSR